MGVYESVQDEKERNPKLKPKPGVEVRWNSTIDEAKRSNQIMGDVCETLSSLHGPDGGDYDMLTADERNSGDLSRLTYTEEDKMIIRQYEGAATAAKTFSKFTQDRRDTWSYVLFELRKVISTSREDSFAIHQGMTIQL